MDSGEIKQHLNSIVENIGLLQSLTSQFTYEDFIKNDPMREKAYAYLKEIGWAAHELRYLGAVLEPNLSIDTLAGFRNARYNQEAEIQHQHVWNLVELDLPVIKHEIRRSQVFAAT